VTSPLRPLTPGTAAIGLMAHDHNELKPSLRAHFVATPSRSASASALEGKLMYWPNIASASEAFRAVRSTTESNRVDRSEQRVATDPPADAGPSDVTCPVITSGSSNESTCASRCSSAP